MSKWAVAVARIDFQWDRSDDAVDLELIIVEAETEDAAEDEGYKQIGDRWDGDELTTIVKEII